MTKKPITVRPRGRPPKPMPRIKASPERIARAMFSAVKKPDPSIRVTKTGHRKSVEGKSKGRET